VLTRPTASGAGCGSGAAAPPLRFTVPLLASLRELDECRRELELLRRSAAERLAAIEELDRAIKPERARADP